jgi:amino acid adenylation domain-containing protein/FkbH-like protein
MFLENEIASKRSETPTAKQSPGEKRIPASVKTTNRATVIPQRSRAESVALGFAQQRLWFLDQLHPESPLYNYPIALHLKGRLNREALQYSLNSILARHEVLRTRFVCREGNPVQIIDPPLSVELPLVDLTQIPKAAREIEAQRLAAIEAKRPFQLAKDSMMRTLLLELEPEEHLLVVTMHHIATDAWSMGIFFHELAAWYEARIAGHTPVMTELPVQYADFAIWQREWLQGEVLENQVAYWKKQLAGATGFLDLPTDRPRPVVQNFRGARQTQQLPGKLTEALKRFSRQEGATPFMTYLAAFKVLLHRYSKQSDILVGCPIAGRTIVETEKLIGFFVNTLVFRTDLSGDPTFKEVLGRVREVAFGAFAHQELPFDKLVEELHPERTTSQVPLIQVMFVFQNAPAQSFNLSGLTLEPVEVSNETAKFDLTLFLEERTQGLTAIWEYNLDLFNEATIKRICGHFVNLLEGIAADAGQRVSQLPLLTDAERHQLLVGWNDTRTEYPRGRCVHELFEEQARLTPDAIALTFGERHLTYQELNARANQLAHYLRKAGVQPGRGVGLCLERSLTLVVGLLAILKAGGGYAALEPNLPKERLATMLEDLQSPVLLTQEKLVPLVQKAFVPERFRAPVLICLDHDWSEFASESTENPEVVSGAADLAYVSFTSGSTGRPKGVCVPHRAVVRLVRNTNYASFSPADVFLQLAPVSFDASTWEIWGCLLNGARLVIFPPYTPSLTELGEAIQSQRVTTLWLTSGLFNQVVEERPECLKPLRQLLTGGDVLSVPHVKKALSLLGEGCRLINGYGPTENTTFTACHPILPGFTGERSVPIGRPISNTQCYVVDEHLQPVPIGVPGELLAGGDGLALGYLNRPELTAEKFVPHPFSGEPGARLYRTGDLVRFMADGSLEFLGRMDLQVKVRGFRIELGEIESSLSRHAGVEACVVVAREDEAGAKRLVAYVVGPSRLATGAGELRRFLSEKLPEYMLPSTFVFLDELPLTPNGKVDRRALPAPDQGRPDLEIKYVEPGDILEQGLAKIWEAVLGVQPVGMEDKFFDLGGHSLLAVRLLARVEKEFGRKLPLAAVFQAPTVGQMARLLRDEKGLEPGSSLVEIQPKGSRPPLFLVHGVGGGMFWGYTNLSRSLGLDQPLYALKSKWMNGETEFDSIEEMAAQYVADVRAFQPAGPYYLGGYCFGGNVAYEMARQLQAQGEQVALLAVMNCAPPNSSYGKLNWSPGFILKFLRNLVYLIARSVKWGPEQRREFLRWKAALFKRRLTRVLHLSHEAARQIDVDELVDLSTFPEDQRQLWEIHIRALLKYTPKPYAGRVSLFRSRGHPMFCSYDPMYGWGELAREVEVNVVPGAHESILEEPHVKVLAERLKECVLKVCEPRASATAAKPEVDERTKVRPSTAVNGNETEVNYPRDLCVHQLFEEQVKRTPEAVAVTFGEQQLTYGELNRRADRLADHLQSLGVGSDMPVGICLQRSLDQMVGVLGILKAGGAYVPLDPAYPRERLALMLENARATVLVTQQDLASILPAIPGHVVCLDLPLPTAAMDQGPLPRATADSLAYVIYTSGSTGKPKGVAMAHRPLVNLIWWQLKNSTLGKGDKTLQFASLSFDVSFQEIFSTWCSGGVLVLVREELRRDANRLTRFLQEQQVNRLFLPFVALNQLAESIADGTPVPGTLREIVTAGEQLRITGKIATLFERLGNCTLHNHYGPSESHVVTAFTLTGAPASWPALPPIGRPIANTQIHLLDEKLAPVPSGEQGEVFIGGDCLARGYLNQPELTAERFISDPFRPGTSGRLYKTGDLASCLPDGNIQFLGRADHQVKMRGYRIELGEIEAVLGQYPGVRECAVAVREDVPGHKRLVAYVVYQPGQTMTFSDLRRFLLEKLPDYMVPTACVLLEALPLTPSGKVNRLGLPAPDQGRPELAEQYLAPTSLMEERLAGIWREVLDLKQIGVQDNFFELGGHSLIIAQVISRVREALELELPSSSLFEAPTITALAEGIQSGRWGPGQVVAPPLQPVPRKGNPPLSFAQRLLWFIDRLEPDSHAYHVPVALRLEGSLNVNALQRSLNQIAHRHEILRTTIGFEDSDPVQVISADENVALRRVDLRGLAEARREKEARMMVNEEARRPFDLASGPLLRCLLVQLSDREYILAMVMHHIISDGWSIGILLKELDLLYRAMAAGEAIPALPELPVQYADYAQWQQKWMQGAVLEKHVAYWKAKLAGAPPSLKLPVDHASPVDAATCLQETLVLPAPLLALMLSQSRREGVTPFMTLMATLAIILQRWTAQSDIVIGTVVAGRNRREIENLIGCFMNFVPVRAQLSEEQTGREFLLTVRHTVLEAQAHQECPFEKVVEAINPERRLVQNPLYNVALLLQNFPEGTLNSETLTMRLLPVELHAALLDLRFIVEETAGTMSVTCEYKPGLFEAASIKHLLNAFENTLETLIQRPETPLAQFDPPQRLTTQAKVAKVEPDAQTLAIAATFTAEPLGESLKFWMKELGIPARVEFAPYNQVFQQLLDPGSLLAANARGINVVLFRWEDWERYEGDPTEAGMANGRERLERNVDEFITAIRMAASRTAAPWLVCLCPAARSVTVDAARAALHQQMETRLSVELERLSAVYLVTAKEINRLYPVTEYHDPRTEELGRIPYTPVFFAALGTMIARKFHALQRPAFKVIVLDCDQTLWAGVCGEDGPKGIRLDPSRQALQEFMRAQHEAGMLLCVSSKNNEEDVAAVFSQRMEMPLRRDHFAGWRVNWRPKSENLKALAHELRLGLDSFIFVDDNPLECAEVEANCGEVLTLQLPESPELIPQFLKHCWAFDHLKLSAEDRQRSALYKQDQKREQFRSETSGLGDFLAGLNLKVGMEVMSDSQLIRASQLTQRTNQFNFTTRRRTESELQAVRQGDKHQVLTVSVSDRFGDYGLVGMMIWQTAAGALEVDTFLLSCRVLGRGVEHQMLARLGKMALRQGLDLVDIHFVPSAKNRPAFNFLESVAAQYRQSLNGGYVYRVPAELAVGLKLNPTAFDDRRSESQAPPRGVPAREPGGVGWKTRWRRIALEANDARHILQTIEERSRPRANDQHTYVAPRTDIEEMLCKIWEEFLRVKRVGVQDNFFELGGHSLLAVRLFAEVEKQTGRKLPLVTIFQNATVEQLAAVLSQQSGGTRSSVVAIQSQGAKPPLFLIHGAGGDVLWGYANLSAHLGTDQPVYGIKSRALNGAEEFTSLEDMAAFYVRQVRRFQKKGPYQLGGYCFGGNVAYEMARQFQAQGEAVALVALLDSAPANGSYEQMKWWQPSFALKFMINSYYWLDDFCHTKMQERREFVFRKARAWRRKLARKVFNAAAGPVEVDLEEVIDLSRFPEHELRLWQLHLNALATHVSRPYSGRVTLFRTRGQPLFCSLEDDFNWGELVGGGVDIRLVPGSHESIFVEPAVQSLAKELKSCLMGATTGGTAQEALKSA